MTAAAINGIIRTMDDVAMAAGVLRAGGLVAFPTETVYGLGADATSSSAIRKIFEAKGRPPTNPLIIHVADEPTARQFAASWPETASRLVRRFWPGPLTLVVPKSDRIVPEATAKLATAGFRCPDHPLALALLRAFAGPVAAPSANRSSRVSPTTAQHVREELGTRVDFILDGGACPVGIESTVLDLTTPTPMILRPGAITAGQIEAEIGRTVLFEGVADPAASASSPGQQAVHYAPSTAAYRFESADRFRVATWCREHLAESWAIVAIGSVDAEAMMTALPGMDPDRHALIEMPTSAREYARRLYATLRDLDARNLDTIWMQMPPDEPQWAAVRDRLSRATRAAGGVLAGEHGQS